MSREGRSSMAIWQAMKGNKDNPKQEWICDDLRHQHFSEFRGRKLVNQVKKGDLMLIYFPGRGNRVCMGLQRAAEKGPHKLSPEIQGADLWPWGLEVKDHIWIPGRQLGVDLDELARYLPGRHRRFRPGLAPVDGWGSRTSIRALIKEIKKRGEDPLTWKTWPRSL